MEIGAQETVFAAVEVIGKSTVLAVLAIEEECRVIALMNAKTLIAKL